MIQGGQSDAAKRNHVKLQIGQCIRFSPQYQCLRDLVRSGKVIRAEFSQISPTPLWAWNKESATKCYI